MSHPPLAIAIIGLGVAGKARQKAIAELPGFRLAGIVSRRPDVATAGLEEILQNSDVSAVAISTENTDHASRTRQALAAGKHVLCDYPLAFSETEGRELFAMARGTGKVLHVEHIALLAEEHQKLKSEIAAKGSLVKGDYLFQGGWNPKLEDLRYTGAYPFLAVSRLVQIADLFGPFELESQQFEKNAQGFRLHLHLKFPGGGKLGFTEERVAGLARRRSILAEMSEGQVHWKAQTFSGGLFGKDLQWFRDRVLNGKPCYYDETMLLKILGMLERVAS